MPTLYLSILLIFWVSKRKYQYRIYYETLPLYLKGISYYCKISREKIVSFIRIITGFNINKIKHGDEVADYPSLRMNTMGKVVRICEQLTPSIEKDKWVLLLQDWLGEKPAIAYTLKYLAHYQIHLHILPFAACYKSLDNVENFLLVCNPGWPIEWFNVVKRNVQEIDFTFYQWPKWYLLLYNILFNTFLVITLPAISLSALLKRGWVVKKINKKHFKLITEFIDPQRLNRTPFDADYWVDGRVIKESDILFFLTQEQLKMLKKHGYKVADIIKTINTKGYEWFFLNDLPYSKELIWPLFLSYISYLRSIIKKENILILGNVFLKAWREYLEYAPLFAHFHAKSFIYLTIPHGQTGWRKNSAFITGLCRKHGIKTFGCQTRVIDSKQYEHCFDCYDVYFSWGSAWQDILEEGMKYIDKVVEIGCIHLDALVPVYQKYVQNNNNSFDKKSLYITIFTTDIDVSTGVYSGCFYPLSYTSSFLESCAKLAKKNPDIKFTVKTKDPEHVELLLSQEKFQRLYKEVANNFHFEKRSRTDYLDILSSSNIVIAIGYTTPGIEALFLGKRVIYYSELKEHGKAFKRIPDLVAEDENKFNILFNQAMHDYSEYTKIHSNNLNQLDKFRDGRAKERIIKFLSERAL